MIIDFIISVFATFVKGVFYILPSLPDMPEPITSGGDWLINTVTSVASVLTMVYSPALMAIMISTAILLLNFEHIYHVTMWILRKIPVINMK